MFDYRHDLATDDELANALIHVGHEGAKAFSEGNDELYLEYQLILEEIKYEISSRSKVAEQRIVCVWQEVGF